MQVVPLFCFWRVDHEVRGFELCGTLVSPFPLEDSMDEQRKSRVALRSQEGPCHRVSFEWVFK